MTSSSPKSVELSVTFDFARTELVRSFIREAALADGIPASVCSLIASDGAEVWQVLSANARGDGRAHITLSSDHHEVRARIGLTGHSRFVNVIGSLKARTSPGGGLSCQERGVDGWEVCLHRPLGEEAPPDTAISSAPVSTAVLADQDFQIDLAQKSDAPAIARCFLAVYGHSYVHPDVFSPRRYWSRVESGELIPVIARDAGGEVIGHVALERQAGAVVAERGEAVVLPQFRGHHLLERMTDRLSEEAPRHGLHGVYAEPLTIHTFSQRNDVRAGMPVCAVLLGANPENFRPKDIACPTAGQRQSYLRTFRFVQPPARRSLQPLGPYQDMVLKIYERLGVRPEIAARSAPPADASRTGLSVNTRGYGAIRFQRIGANCGVELSQAVRDVLSLGARSIQLAAPIGDAGLPALIATARDEGFFFCGLGPGFADGEDLLLMQQLTEPLDISKLQLFTDEAKELSAFIDADRGTVARNG